MRNMILGSIVTALSIVGSVFADSQAFYPVVLHHGSDIQYKPLTEKDGYFYLGGDGDKPFTVTDFGSVRYGDDSYISIASDGKLLIVKDLITKPTDPPTFGLSFAIANTVLTYKGVDHFYAVPVNPGQYVISVESAENAIPIFLRAQLKDGKVIEYFTPIYGNPPTHT